MKLKGNVTISNHLSGSLDEREIVGFIRQTVEIPEGSTFDMYVTDTDGLRINITQVQFEVFWSSAQEGTARELPARVVTQVAPDAKQG